MKKVFLLVGLLTSFDLALAQTYVPFPDSNVYWNEIELYQGQCDPPESDLFQVYPNPVKYQTFVTISSAEIINTIELFDITGHMIRFQENIISIEFQLQLNTCKKGIYLLKVNFQHNPFICNRLIIN